jgi:hypothetical protein
MTTDNRRKEEESKAKTEESRESLVPLANSAVVDKAERKTSILLCHFVKPYKPSPVVLSYLTV